ncbi:ATP synthase epsilon chain [Demequina sediminis]|uniref:ATP synthase epsilon chain n=1 Tax=Demequina sediminis TaxID=1930058 RepID=A0ABP9WH98_9MICO|nr:F0F1 ATP synthase subunit epsilon [Demequina sediminis]BDZ60316.1 F0F1 ATP synthase subunit epsilon [Demequina sediminis]
MAGPLTVDVVAPDQVLWSGTAERLVAPTVEGEIGLLTGHEPVLSVLKSGVVRVRGGADGDAEFPIESGFLSFDHDVVTVVVEPVEDHQETAPAES